MGCGTRRAINRHAQSPPTPAGDTPPAQGANVKALRLKGQAVALHRLGQAQARGGSRPSNLLKRCRLSLRQFLEGVRLPLPARPYRRARGLEERT